MSNPTITILITQSCQYKSGVSAKGNNYTMAEAYAVLPGTDFPQKFSYYCESAVQVLSCGEYEVDILTEVRDGRIQFNIDPRKGRKIVRQTAQPVKSSGQA
jgi:hypothetical protein